MKGSSSKGLYPFMLTTLGRHHFAKKGNRNWFAERLIIDRVFTGHLLAVCCSYIHTLNPFSARVVWKTRSNMEHVLDLSKNNVLIIFHLCLSVILRRC